MVSERVAAPRRAPGLRRSRDWVLTAAAVATVLSSVFGLGPFEGPGGRTADGSVRQHMAALR